MAGMTDDDDLMMLKYIAQRQNFLGTNELWHVMDACEEGRYRLYRTSRGMVAYTYRSAWLRNRKSLP